MTSYLVTGGGGMLGTDVAAVLSDRDVVSLDRSQLDVTDALAVASAVTGFDVVINCSAYTRVDDAEAREDDARAINAVGAGNLATAAAANGAILVQVSTDYVFDGRASAPYAESAPRAPVSAYGRTKAEGEELALAANERTIILRTAWLYGAHGTSFPATMMRLARERDTLDVVDDQVGQPTWTRDLATQLLVLLDRGIDRGVFHGTNSGSTTWFGLARAVFEETGLDPARVHATDSASFVRPAPRPAYSVLGHDNWVAAGIAPMRPWREALRDALASGLGR